MEENKNTENTFESDSSKKQSESKKAMNGMQGGIVFAVISGLCAHFVYKFYEFPIGKIIFWLILIFVVLCCLVVVSCFFDWKTAKKIEKLEADAREEEKEFSEIDPSKRALRAEKMFKMGILIVVANLVMYIYTDADKTLLLVGNISGIIVDFVGAVFIKMYTQNVEAAVRFHAKFAESNNLLLANSIANKIENEELREMTLSEIAKDIIMSNNKVSE